MFVYKGNYPITLKLVEREKFSLPTYTQL